jgi:hypothetical protein
MYAAQWALPAEVWDAEPTPVASPATVVGCGTQGAG